MVTMLTAAVFAIIAFYVAAVRWAVRLIWSLLGAGWDLAHRRPPRRIVI